MKHANKKVSLKRRAMQSAVPLKATVMKATKKAEQAKAKKKSPATKAMKFGKKKDVVSKTELGDSMMALPFDDDLGLEGMGDVMSQFDLIDFSRNGGDDITSGFDTIANMGGDAYASQSFAMSSVKGRDGKLHVEKYMSSDIGNVKHKIREGKQAYSNSTSGMQKMAVERQHGKRGRKLVCEKNVFTGKEHTHEMFRGMDERHKNEFDKAFQSNAHHMPHHLEDTPSMPSAASKSGRRALPQSSKSHQPR